MGSNLGDRAGNLLAAVDALGVLPGTTVVATSSFFETPALKVGKVDPGGAYLNAAVVLRSTLSPRHLLAALNEIERSRGRDRTLPHGSPRPLDLDLVLYGDQVINEPDLCIPHPRMHERLFVLEPLAEIAPEWVVPGRDKTVKQLMKQVRGLR
jgi:2-amino-4-hydroxy-6-hydroxymethyldihydropteridine diphosphokinase